MSDVTLAAALSSIKCVFSASRISYRTAAITPRNPHTEEEVDPDGIPNRRPIKT